MTPFLNARFRTQYISTKVTQTIKEKVIWVDSERKHTHTHTVYLVFINSIFYLFQEIHQQQPVAQSTAAMEKGSLDVENPPAAKARKKTGFSFFKKSMHTMPTASASTTCDPTIQCPVQTMEKTHLNGVSATKWTSLGCAHSTEITVHTSNKFYIRETF